MAQFSTPEGYAPYRLFTYSDDDVVCVLRPEQFIGVTTVNPGFHEAIRGADVWAAEVALKDGGLTVQFGCGPTAEHRCRTFIVELRAFMEEDALRNAHNAVMRKGKTNG